MTPYRWRVILWTVTLVAVAVIAWNARGALFPFGVGAVLAYALSPVVDRLERFLPPRGDRRESVRRGIAVLLIYVAVFGGTGVIGVLLAPTAFDQVNHFIDELPTFIERSRVLATDWLEEMRGRMHPDISAQIERSTSDMAGVISDATVAALRRSVGVVTGSLSMLFGFAIVPFWMFYAMRDRHTLERSLLRATPPALRADLRNVARIADYLVSRYIRGQLFLGVVVGVAVGGALTLMGVEMSLGLGLWAGITELIPIIGPWLGAAAGLIIVAATDPGMLIWVGLLYLAVQQLENNLLVPRIQGHAVDLHPGAVIVLLAVAGAVWGLVGMLVVIPATAILRELFWYLDRRLSGETAEEAFAHSHVGTRQRDLPLDARMDEPITVEAPAD